MPKKPVAGRRKSPRGVYKDVYRHYAQLIDSDQMRPGDRIPTSSVIAKVWNISHATAAKSLHELRAEGYVTTSSKGTFVSHGKTLRLLHRLSDALNALEKEGQSLQIESGEHGTYIVCREGAVRWNELAQLWEPTDV